MLNVYEAKGFTQISRRTRRVVEVGGVNYQFDIGGEYECVCGEGEGTDLESRQKWWQNSLKK
jgi:hypothetical protein